MALYSRVGSVFPYLHAVSVGKVYLSLMSEEKRHQVIQKIGLPAITKYTITDPETLEAELMQTKTCCFGFEDQELREGVRRIADPIFNFSGKHVGCIGMSASIFNFDLKDKKKYGEMVANAARKTSADMGYQSNNGPA
ncbi:IclR family transcriptional regulator [Desulfosarcina ovata]|uniref:IclR-ED domain-containing protein n=1 Tax=Desulfosarcina ovata subsp. ovata TaxID=2752305 RepID=A0A5K8AI76_9BACT|nr:IclR family transcriptional regulator C-terminal domain-containing protein [Desulfosarcina ovata]BBO92347.1 hypothetical protein DSCOOX_55270 [Desulfosarcina ovata subsp. ovata]